MEVRERCTICKHPVDTKGPSASTLGEKGSSAINQASNLRKDSIHTVPGEKVHKDCCQKYCNPHQIAKDTKQEKSKPSTSGDRHVLGSSEEGFCCNLCEVDPIFLVNACTTYVGMSDVSCFVSVLLHEPYLHGLCLKTCLLL